VLLGLARVVSNTAVFGVDVLVRGGPEDQKEFSLPPRKAENVLRSGRACMPRNENKRKRRKISLEGMGKPTHLSVVPVRGLERVKVDASLPERVDLVSAASCERIRTPRLKVRWSVPGCE
jgi:hypothetical protein